MPVPETSQTVPDFILKELRNSTVYHLADMTARAPTLVAFFKRSCMTSKLTLPFIERLHQNYPALQTLGVSQDSAAETAEFAQATGLSFAVLLDEDWKVSAAYDLFTVPTVFLLDTNGIVKRVNMGWNKEHYTALSDEIAGLLGVTVVPLLNDADKVPAFRPG